jgi:nucleoside 2-deoxyribosyltransferase
MKHRLDGAMFYLAGPMDDVEDRGAGWREMMAEFLWYHDIGVLCPFSKATYGHDEDDEYYQNILKMKKAERYPEMHNIIREVVADDYRMVDKCDAQILYIDKNAHMCGSYHESGLATYQRKPTIICCPQGKQEIPHWMFGICKHELMFDNWDDVKAYIKHVCYAEKVDRLNRWRFFDYNKVFGRNRVVNEGLMGS